MRTEALDLYRKGIEQPKANVEDYLALGVALARMEEWDEATRVLNQAVRRNRERFPAHFMLPLTRSEIERISQFVISLKFSKSVYAFTEQGVAMLSSVLHSDWAIRVNIAIMDAFVRLRETLASHKKLARKLAELERRIGKHDEHIQALFDAIHQLMAPPTHAIGFHMD